MSQEISQEQKELQAFIHECLHAEANRARREEQEAQAREEAIQTLLAEATAMRDAHLLGDVPAALRPWVQPLTKDNCHVKWEWPLDVLRNHIVKPWKSLTIHAPGLAPIYASWEPSLKLNVWRGSGRVECLTWTSAVATAAENTDAAAENGATA